MLKRVENKIYSNFYSKTYLIHGCWGLVQRSGSAHLNKTVSPIDVPLKQNQFTMQKQNQSTEFKRNKVKINRGGAKKANTQETLMFT